MRIKPQPHSAIPGRSEPIISIRLIRGLPLKHENCARHYIIALLKRVAGCTVRCRLVPTRRSQCKYFIPSEEKRGMFTVDALPVFAYLDVGIYGHPIYNRKTKGVKIGFYNPPDVTTVNTRIRDVHSFVDECMPALGDAAAIDVTDA